MVKEKEKKNTEEKLAEIINKIMNSNCEKIFNPFNISMEYLISTL